jgi:murein DD-endopeptidase MepM/ murein hydrolase activator NlpD
MRSGVVYQAGYHALAGWRVGIDHGSFVTRYLHLSRILVAEGQRVTSLTIIGLSGNSGDSDGPHLHVEAFRDFSTPLDPGGCF